MYILMHLLIFNSLSCKQRGEKNKLIEQKSVEEVPSNMPKQNATQQDELVLRSTDDDQKYFMYGFIPKYSKNSDGELTPVAECKKCHLILTKISEARMKRH